MITLKSIKHFPSLSEGTTAFQANIYWNEEKVGTCSNRGAGEAISFEVYDSIIQEMSAYAKTLPPTMFDGEALAMNLELHVFMLVEDFVAANDQKKEAKKEKTRVEKWVAKKKAENKAKNYGTIQINLPTSTNCIPFKEGVHKPEEIIVKWQALNPTEHIINWKTV